MVDSRAQVSLLLRLVLRIPVTDWENHGFRLGDTEEEDSLEWTKGTNVSFSRSPSPFPPKARFCLGTDPLRETWA